MWARGAAVVGGSRDANGDSQFTYERDFYFKANFVCKRYPVKVRFRVSGLGFRR